MGFEKRGPRRLSFPVRSRLDPVLLAVLSVTTFYTLSREFSPACSHRQPAPAEV